MWKLNNFKNNIAVITENGKNISYGELDLYCRKLTDNIKNRCLVFNLCKNEIGSLVGYIGFLNARIVPLMLKADLEYELFHNLLETYKPAYIWLPKEQAKDYNFENVYEDLDYALLKTNLTI